MVFDSSREFSVWDYNVSHAQLLIRSPKSTEMSDNIDIVFWGVKYVEIPTSFVGLSLSVAGGDAIQRVKGVAGVPCEKETVFFISVADGRRFIVVSQGFKVLRNKLDIFDSTLEYFAATDTKRDLGEVMAHS